MIDHVLALLRQEAKETQLRVYITDSLQLIAENTAKMVQGKYIPTRWADTLKPQENDNRSSDEIAADVIRRAGLFPGGNNG